MSDKTVALVDVCRSIKVNPKVARQRLRRRFDDLGKEIGYQPKDGAPSWEFPTRCKPRLIKFLKSA